MATNRVINGVTYVIPDQNDNFLWGTGLSGWVGAVTNGALFKAGGTFTLTSDVNFGTSFGLISLYYKSASANLANSGNVRLSNTDSINFAGLSGGVDAALVVAGGNKLRSNTGLDANSITLSNVATPVAATDAATKAYVDAANTFANSALFNASDYVNALNYVSAQGNTGTGSHCASMVSGNNVLTISPGPFVFTANHVGMQLYVSGMSTYAQVASFISATQVTMNVNAPSTQTIADFAVFNTGQDDTVGIQNTFNACNVAKSKAYFPARVYIYANEFDVSGLQGIVGDGVNRTIFLPKALGTSQLGGFLNIPNMPAGCQVGGDGQGFRVVGPTHRAPCHQANLSISLGLITANVDTGALPLVGSVYKLLGARGTASPYNEGYWKISTAASGTWTGTPYYADDNPAIGAVSAVAVTSNVLTVLESNAFRKVGYVTYFSNVATATFLNGTSATVTSIVYSGTSVVGYTYALTHANYANTADTGTVANYADTGGTVTDNFASIPKFDGIRLSTNNFPANGGGSNILIFPSIKEVFVSNFSGAGFRLLTPNFGYMGKTDSVGVNEGYALEGLHPTTGFFSNPSCFEIGQGLQFESCTLVGISIKDAGGIQTGMIGGGGAGIGLLLYNCNGTDVTSFDFEVMTPWAVDPTMYPGHNIELRGAQGCEIHCGYLSFNSSNASIGVYMWNGTQACKYEGSRHFLAGTPAVQPNNEVYIDASCIDCFVGKTNYVSSTAFTNLSPTSVLYEEGGTYDFNGTSGSLFRLQNITPATNGSPKNSPGLILTGTNWNGSASVSESFLLQVLPNTNSSGAATVELSHAAGAGVGSIFSYNGNWVVDGGGNMTVGQQNNGANSTFNSNSPFFNIQGAYWNGAASAADAWTLQNSFNPGANGNSTLRLTHSGNPNAQFQIAANIGGTITLIPVGGEVLILAPTANVAQVAAVGLQITSNNATAAVAQTYNFGINQTSGDFNLFNVNTACNYIAVSNTGSIKAPASPLNNTLTQVVTGLSSRLTANTNRLNTTVLANEANLTISLNETGTYSLMAWLVFGATSNGVGGIVIDFGGGSATINAIATSSQGFVAGAVTATPVVYGSGAGETNFPIDVISGGANDWLSICGTVTTNTAGTLVPRYAQHTATGNATNLLLGSWLQVTKIS